MNARRRRIDLEGLAQAYLHHRGLLVSSLRNIIRDPAQLTPELVDAVVAEASRPGALEAFAQWQRDRPDRVVGAVVEFLRRVPGR